MEQKYVRIPMTSDIPPVEDMYTVLIGHHEINADGDVSPFPEFYESEIWPKDRFVNFQTFCANSYQKLKAYEKEIQKIDTSADI